MGRKRRILFVVACLLLIVVLAINQGWLLVGQAAGNFRPPTRKTRLAAIGNISKLSAAQKAMLDDTDFDEIPAPGPSDWLANHEENGQTFRQYMMGQPNVPDQVRNKLYLQPLGDFQKANGPDLASVKDYAERFFQMPVVIRPAVPIDGLPIKSRVGADRQKQMLSTDVLEWCSGELPDDAFCILAITMIDLYPQESWNFVFGQASLRHRVGVYSFARYSDPSEAVVLRRSCRVLAHETGHMFGIKHCIFFSCLMNGSNHLGESDRQPLHLCPVCLRKMQTAIGFDGEKRLGQLKEFADKVGWKPESKWLDGRLKRIAAAGN